ncbi:MAG: hypothetical protein LBP41_02355 [Holosporaceae bacterium]|jgi:hypothetical protein|nr:hypothetical protein [Holosporaceae bacterium]
MQLLLINLEKTDGRLRLEFGNDEEFYSEDAEDGKTIGIVTVNRDNFDSDGISKYRLCGVNSMNKLVEKTCTISEAIFHELCHALHEYSGKEMNNCKLLTFAYGDKKQKCLWTEDEEAYTITGYYYDGSMKLFDPISCNMYDICANISKPENIVQRVFHYSYGAYGEYLISNDLSESDALDNIKEFLIDPNEYAVKNPYVVTDKIIETTEK